MHGKLLAKD